MSNEDIIARMSLDDRDYKRGLQEAVSASKKAGKDIERGLSMSGVREGIRKATDAIFNLRSAAIVAGSALAVSVGNRALETAAKLDDLSQQTKVSAESIQILRYAFQANGVEIGQTDAALAQFSMRLGSAATGNKGLSELFAALGVSIRDARGELRPTTDVLNDTIAALAQVRNQSERQAIAAQLFGKQAGPAMAKLLGEGIEGIRKYEDELRNMGGVLSDELVKKAADADSQMKSLRTTLKASFDVGVLESYASTFGDFTNMAKDPALAQAFHNLGQLIGLIASGLLKSVEMLSKLYDMTGNARDSINMKMLEADIRRYEAAIKAGVGGSRGELLLKIEEAKAKRAEIVRQRTSGKGFAEWGVTGTTTQTGTSQLNMGAPLFSPLDLPKINDANTAAGRLNRTVKDTAKSAETLGNTFEDAFSDILSDISRGSLELRSFGDLARSVLQSIVSSEGFQNSVLTPLSDMAGSFFGSLFGGSGGARSGGGPVNPGMSYLVGENGPERLVMGRNSGYVVSANQRGGGGQVNNTYIYNNAGAQVSTQERTNTSGGRDLMVTIDEMVSNVLADPSSRSSRALRKSSGLRPSLTTR